MDGKGLMVDVQIVITQGKKHKPTIPAAMAFAPPPTGGVWGYGGGGTGAEVAMGEEGVPSAAHYTLLLLVQVSLCHWKSSKYLHTHEDYERCVYFTCSVFVCLFMSLCMQATNSLEGYESVKG